MLNKLHRVLNSPEFGVVFGLVATLIVCFLPFIADAVKGL